MAVPVAQNLDLDVTRAADEPLNENGFVAESCRRLAARLLQLALEFGEVLDHPHAPSASSEGGFNDERKADFLGNLCCLPRVRDRLLGSGNYWNSRTLRKPARGRLVTE